MRQGDAVGLTLMLVEPAKEGYDDAERGVGAAR